MKRWLFVTHHAYHRWIERFAKYADQDFRTTVPEIQDAFEFAKDVTELVQFRRLEKSYVRIYYLESINCYFVIDPRHPRFNKLMTVHDNGEEELKIKPRGFLAAKVVQPTISESENLYVRCCKSPRIRTVKEKYEIYLRGLEDVEKGLQALSEATTEAQKKRATGRITSGKGTVAKYYNDYLKYLESQSLENERSSNENVELLKEEKLSTEGTATICM